MPASGRLLRKAAAQRGKGGRTVEVWRYRSAFAYLESDGQLLLRGQEVQGLGLPASVLERLYYINAQVWYPGL